MSGLEVTDIEKYYANSEAFKTYVDAFCKKHGCIVSEALEIAVVIETYKMYKKLDK